MLRYAIQGKPKSRASSDDDDFIVPDDSDAETRSVRSQKSSSSRRSSTSSRTSHASSDEENDEDFDEDDREDEAPKKTKTKIKGKTSGKSSSSKSAIKAAGVSGDGMGNGTYSLLTAAEQREQEKKDDKKAAESPYDFLMDVRDVSYSLKSETLDAYPLFCNNRKMGRNLDRRVMILGPYLYPRRPGLPLHPLKSRYVTLID